MSQPLRALPARRFDDFQAGQIYSTYRRTVTETDLVNFTQFAGLRLPIFIDEEHARASAHGGRIVPGFLTASISAGMLESVLGENVLAGLAMDDFRFNAAVRPGDTLTAEVVIENKKETSNPARGILTLRVRVLNQREDCVLEYITSVLIAR